MFEGIRRRVELLLDVQSARRMEAEAQRALDRGTDPREAVQNLKRVDAQTGQLGTAFRKIGAVVGAVFAVHKIREFVSEMWELGTASEEGGSKFATTFGAASERMRAFLSDWGRFAGLNRVVGQDFAATAGAIVQGMGASKDASAGFSEQMLRLAGDLTSFHNVPIEETFAALRSGLTGEYEPLKRFGIILSADEVALRALTETGKKHKDELTQFDLAQARLTLTLQRAGVAIGDLDRTQDSTANTARRLKADFEDFKIELAEGLLPIFADVVAYLSANKDSIAEGARTATRQVGELLLTIGEVGRAIASPFVLAFKVRTYVNGVEQDVRDYFNSISWIRNLNEKLLAAHNTRAANELAERQGLNLPPALTGETAAQTAARVSALAAAGGAIDAMGRPYRGTAPAPGPTISPKPTAAEIAAAKRRAKALSDAFGEEFDRLVGLRRAHGGEVLPALAGNAHFGVQDRIDHATGRRVMPNAPVAGLRTTPVETPADPPGIIVPEQLGEFEMAYLEMLSNVERASERAASEIAGAFSSAFELMIEEGVTVGNFMEGLGRGLAGAMLGGLAEFAQTKVAYNIARALEAAGEALGFTSLGLFGNAGAAWAAVAEHTAAAAAWGGLAGGAVAGGRTLSGRGGHGGPRSPYDSGLDRSEKFKESRPVVHIYIDPLDPYNPAYQRNVLAAEQFAKERYGPEAEIIVQPRTGG